LDRPMTRLTCARRRLQRLSTSTPAPRWDFRVMA